MPILSTIGRKDPKVRFLIASIYLLLIGGSVTMVYPFLIMIAGSTKSQVDVREFRPWPSFLTDDDALYRKHVEGLFNERLVQMKVTYDLDVTSFERVEPPEPTSAALLDAWRAFIHEAGLPDYSYGIGYVHAPLSKTFPEASRAFKKKLIKEFGNDIVELNSHLQTEFVNWNAFQVRSEFYLPRRNAYLETPFYQRLRAFKQHRPVGDRFYLMVEGFYRSQFLKTQYSRDIAQYNQAHNTRHGSYDDIRLTQTVPAGTAQEQEDWELFVRHSLHPLWIRVDEDAAPDYRAFLRAKYGSIQVLNRNYQADYVSFDKIRLIEEPRVDGVVFSDWVAFLQGWRDPDTGIEHQPAVEYLRIHSIEFLFRDFLVERFGGIEAINGTFGTAFDTVDELFPPQRAMHYQDFLERRKALSREFVVRNYITVIDYMVLHGRGILNTVIYCVLAVVLALLVNPLAAYALSRYRLKNTYKILLFMLLTMAFPPMVTQIPVFLMLRDLNLLNTFAALVLPGMAHGYSIFLLKGFFDSLPRELFESAEIDGAGEWVMFWNITMSLSKPILAVVALGAFTAAYSNFMFALLICQDERMWTLMVWLFQLQQRSGQGVIYASLLLAAIPTFLIFLFCQNIIMRGIVVPVEK